MLTLLHRLLYLLTVAMAVSWAVGDGSWTQRLTVSEGIGVVFLFVFFFWRLAARRPVLFAGRFFPALAVLFLICTTSVAINLDRYIDRTWIVEFCVFLYLAFLGRAIAEILDSDALVQRILTIWLTTATTVATVAIAQGFGIGGSLFSGLAMHDDFRPSVGFRNSAQLGIYLGTTFFVAVAYSRISRLSPWRKKLAAAAMGTTLIGAVVASRRSVMVAIVTGLAAIIWVHRKRLGAQFRLALLVGAAASCLLMVLSANAVLRNYMTRRFDVFNADSFNADAFYSSQLYGAWSAFTSSPIFGIGFSRYAASEFDSGPSLVGFGLEIHSTYLQILAETGIVGLIGYSAFMIALLRLSFLVGFRYRDPVWSEFAKTMTAGFVGLMVSWSYNRQLRDRGFWLLMAIVVAVHRFARQRLNQRKLVAANLLAVQTNRPVATAGR